jgi:hypothetical protein
VACTGSVRQLDTTKQRQLARQVFSGEHVVDNTVAEDTLEAVGYVSKSLPVSNVFGVAGKPTCRHFWQGHLRNDIMSCIVLFTCLTEESNTLLEIAVPLSPNLNARSPN